MSSTGPKRGAYRKHFTRNRREPQSQSQDAKAVSVRPTHFLSLPLGQYPSLRTKVKTFQDELVNTSSNAIAGLDPSIIINPRRLHLTLGVMALQAEQSTSGSDPGKTVQTALELLRSIQPRLVNEGALQVPLQRLGAFESKKGARVLWVSPDEEARQGESLEDRTHRERLMRVCNLVHRTFKDAGYITDTRPLKLHCTIVNTSHRKPSSKRHLSFSFDDILRSPALTNIRIAPSLTTSTTDVESTLLKGGAIREAEAVEEQEGMVLAAPTRVLSSKEAERIVDVDMGTYSVSEIQLCVMGSHGPEDEYVSVGAVSLTEI
ncbi:hypothetical protein VNI00_006579 [Paramarasmius palmivorus]|uniref:A-kinase anchor protein 7-like phosphoesterase domain-containing protein n=1 Tax=Paramarasmius palmivorus TaxID=297713 RepID=A0AAW0D792_9AGAR